MDKARLSSKFTHRLLRLNPYTLAAEPQVGGRSGLPMSVAILGTDVNQELFIGFHNLLDSGLPYFPFILGHAPEPVS